MLLHYSILLVEDDDDDVMLTREHLDNAYGKNYTLDHVSSISSAMACAENSNYDVYLVDYRLGAEDGIEFVHHMAGENRLAAPIILLTGMNQRETDLRAMSAGATDYLVKQNIDARSLERSIRYSINQKRVEEEVRRLARELEKRVAERTGELNLAKEDAEQANQVKSVFLSAMSHELRTPMNVVLGHADLLLNDHLGTLNEAQKQSVGEIYSGGNILFELITKILEYLDIFTSTILDDRQKIWADELISECVEHSRSLADKRGIVLRTGSAPEPRPYLRVNSEALRRVLSILLSNAILYNRPDGSVTISSVLIDEDMVRISISDTGVGISQEMQLFLFQPFNRLEQKNGSVSGAGVGLVVAQHLIEKMDGRIGFVSRKDEGSTFWIELPTMPEPISVD
ncbi:MAG: response regulator [Opitutales bacterium]|nr:response regulator [Opitutales bacterium]